MNFDRDFLAKAHAWPVPWAWAVRITIDEPGKETWTRIWRHTIHSTRAETEQWLKDHRFLQATLRTDARLEVVKIEFRIHEVI